MVIYALLAALAYALQSTLMTDIYRKCERLSAVSMRGLSLGITMSPVLLFATGFNEIFNSQAFFLILIAGFLAALGNWGAAYAYSYLPMGAAGSLITSLIAMVMVFLSFFLLGETLSLVQCVLMIALVASNSCLVAFRGTAVVPREYNPRLGVLFAIIFSVLIGYSFFLVGLASKSLHPFIVGYLWELIIGVWALIFIGIRSKLRPNLRTGFNTGLFIKIAILSAPTALGSSLYSLALSIGPVGIAASVMSCMGIFMALFAQVFFAEKSTTLQWVLILVSCCLLFWLRWVAN